MTPSASRVIIQTIFKSVYIVLEAPEALFTVQKHGWGCVYKVAKLEVLVGLLLSTACLHSFVHL